MLLCPDGGAVTNTLQKLTGPVKTLLDEINTYPLLRDTILEILTRWRCGTRIRPIDYDVSIRSVIGAQSVLVGITSFSADGAQNGRSSRHVTIVQSPANRLPYDGQPR